MGREQWGRRGKGRTEKCEGGLVSILIFSPNAHSAHLLPLSDPLLLPPSLACQLVPLPIRVASQRRGVGVRERWSAGWVRGEAGVRGSWKG